MRPSVTALIRSWRAKAGAVTARSGYVPLRFDWGEVRGRFYRFNTFVERLGPGPNPNPGPGPGPGLGGGERRRGGGGAGVREDLEPRPRPYRDRSAGGGGAMTSRTRTQTIAMIEALRSRLGGVALEIGALCRIGTADAALLRRTLAPAADPAGLLAWAGWQQVHEHAQILVRPAPEAPHPWLLADDIPTAAALAFAARRAALVIETSPGNCQLRVLADRPLSLLDRTTAQRALRAHLAGDPGSIAGDKWGRLAGFKNQKPGRDGCWTNLLRHDLTGRPASASALLAGCGSAPALAPLTSALGQGRCAQGQGSPAPRSGAGARPVDGPADHAGGSKIDFAWACAQIRAGADPQSIIGAITAAALGRKKRSNEAGCMEYAERTIRNAQARIAAERATR